MTDACVRTVSAQRRPWRGANKCSQGVAALLAELWTCEVEGCSQPAQARLPANARLASRTSGVELIEAIEAGLACAAPCFQDCARKPRPQAGGHGRLSQCAAQ